MLYCSQSLFVCRVSFQGHASRYIHGPVHESFVLVASPKNTDEGSSQTLWPSSWDFSTYRICEQRRLRWAWNSQPLLLVLKKKKRWRWRVRPNSIPSKAVVLLLLVHSLMFLPLDCGDSVFVACFVLHYFIFSVLSSYAIILTRKR